MILFHRRFSPVQFSEAKIKGFFTYLPIFLLFPNVKAKNFTKFRICLLLFCVLLASLLKSIYLCKELAETGDYRI